MSQQQPSIALEERYRTPANYLKLAMSSVFPVIAVTLTVLALIYGLDKIAWQMYLFYTPFLLLGLLCAGEVICLAKAIILNTRGMLRIDAHQFVLLTAYYDKTIPTHEITGIEEVVQKFGKRGRVNLCVRQGLKGYYFEPQGLRNDEVIELIVKLNQLVSAARRAAHSP